MRWQQVLPDIFLFRDSCNVYAVHGPDGIVIIDAGSGRWLDHIDQLPGRPVALLCTHYFRDHSVGAIKAAQLPLAVYVPEGEHAIFTDPAQHFRQRESYIIYDNLWDQFVPIEPVSGAKPFQDYTRQTLAGLEIEAVPLPGATLTQTGYAITLPNEGRQIVFCGEAIHSPGRLARIAPLQYNYNDIAGAVNCFYAAKVLRQRGPDALLPSLGDPILSNVDSALGQLDQTLRSLTATFGRGEINVIHQSDRPPLTEVTEHVHLSTHSNARSWFLIGASGKVMTIDYGYNMACSIGPKYAKPDRRRALLHGLDGLKQQFDTDRIDVALLSHFHDDHVCGVPVLQRLFGTECWACDTFAHLIAEPQAHRFPCNWPLPIRVDRTLPIDQTVTWEQFTFCFAPMSGHTRFASLIGFEADGKRFAHTGDQYFFRNGTKNFKANQISPNHVYRNGALLDGVAQSARWMLKWRPDIVLTGHTDAIHTDEDYFRLIDEWTQQYEELHRKAMVLGDDETHFNLDSWGGWIWPYRTHLKKPGPATVTVTVRNPFPRPATMALQLIGPEGWRGTSATIEADARSEVSCQMQITPDGPCRRQPFVVALDANDTPFGQVAEAMMTVGGSAF